MKKLALSALIEVLVFGLVGAPLWTAAGLSLFAFGFWHEDPSAETLRELASLFIEVLPYTMAYAGLIALFDFVQLCLKMPFRQMSSALFGVFSMVWLFTELAQPEKLISVGLLGALPAALCSWLCAAIARRAVAGDPPSPLQATAASPG
jgi:hypothetical protein